MLQIVLFLAVWGITSVGAGFMLGRLFRTQAEPPRHGFGTLPAKRLPPSDMCTIQHYSPGSNMKSAGVHRHPKALVPGQRPTIPWAPRK